MEEEEPFKNKGGQLQRSESGDKPTEKVMDDAHQQEVKEDMTESAIDKKSTDPESKKPEEEDPESKLKDYTVSFYLSGPLPVSIAQKLNESNKGVFEKTTSVESSETGESGCPQTSSDSSMRESWTKQKSTESEQTRTIPSGNSFDTEENFSESEERSPKGTHSLSENGKKTGNGKDSDLGTSPISNLSESTTENSDDNVGSGQGSPQTLNPSDSTKDKGGDNTETGQHSLSSPNPNDPIRQNSGNNVESVAASGSSKTIPGGEICQASNKECLLVPRTTIRTGYFPNKDGHGLNENVPNFPPAGHNVQSPPPVQMEMNVVNRPPPPPPERDNAPHPPPPAPTLPAPAQREDDEPEGPCMTKTEMACAGLAVILLVILILLGLSPFFF